MTRHGDQIIWTDNAPAWAIHSLLLQGRFLDETSFSDWLLNAMPIEFNSAHACKMDAINKARYHVAHLFDVQAGRDNSQPLEWTKREVEIRFLRNVHPCNSFYIPIPKWKVYGGDPAVKTFFSNRYSERYRACWNEFLDAVGGEIMSDTQPAPLYSYSHSDWPRSGRQSRRFRLVKAYTDISTPQIRAIVSVLAADGRGDWNLVEISSLMEKAKTDGRLITKQGAPQIFDFYRRKLLEEGILIELV
jgi:hypothetical protein